jgi:hypothetical protein
MRSRVVIGVLLLWCARAARGDGGTVIARGESGGVLVTAFASALRTGVVDMSVLVQHREGLAPVLDATVELTLMSPGGRELAIDATHGLAQNKLLYAAPVGLDEAGRWTVAVRVAVGGGASSRVEGSFDVAAARAVAYWRYLAIPPGVLLVFALHQWLSYRQGRLPH